MDDDWDLDVLLAEEEEAQTRFDTTSKPGEIPAQPDLDLDVDIDLDMDWDPPPPTHLSSSMQPTIIEKPPFPSPIPEPHATSSKEDEDMWDMIGTVHDE